MVRQASAASLLPYPSVSPSGRQLLSHSYGSTFLATSASLPGLSVQNHWPTYTHVPSSAQHGSPLPSMPASGQP